MDLTDLFKGNNNKRPYIIAEAGVNHEGNLELAKRLIDEAKEGGANAIKFQTYKADKIASKHSPAYWDTTKERLNLNMTFLVNMTNFGKVNLNY